MERSSLYASKFHAVQQFVVYNKGYIKFATMHYTTLNSLYQSTSPPGKDVEFIYINFLKIAFVKMKRPIE